MRVLLQNRQDTFARGGGDAVQMQQTAERLRALGVDAEMSVETAPGLHRYDLVHLFNCFIEDTFKQAANAREQAVPYVISTIYVDGDYYNFVNLDRPLIKLLRSVMGTRRGFPIHHAYSRLARRRTRKWRETRQVLAGASRLLPNSALEGRRLRRDFGVRTPRDVVPNGVDYAAFSGGRPGRFKQRHGLSGYVLCVGRIERFKNQLAIIRALGGTGRALVCAGATLPDQEDYRRQCEREAARLNVPLRIFDPLSVEEQADAYAGADVHVLASWGETTGLVSLEAAAAGCPVVTTVRSPYQEYFGELAAPCRPESVRSIRLAIDRAAGLDTRRLQRQVRERYTWTEAAKRTREAYEKVLKLET